MISIPTTQNQNQTQDLKADKDNLVDVLSDIKGLKNTLRYIKLNQKVEKPKSDLN